MKSALEIGVEQAGAVTVVHVAGEPDLTNVRDLERRLRQGIPNTALGVVVDLSGVRYLDSAGLNLLFTLNRELVNRSQRLALVVPDGALIRPLLQVVRAEAAMQIHATLPEALQAINPSSD